MSKINKYQIYLVLSRRQSDYQRKLVSYFSQLKFELSEIKVNINIKIVFADDYIIENELFNQIPSDTKAYVIWNKYIAGKNLNIIKSFFNSIVFLESKTILLRKVSDKNPINEILASNHGFMLIYMNEIIDDPTNADYKLVVNDGHFLITKEIIKQKLSKNANKRK